jgi:hypothetical protein
MYSLLWRYKLLLAQNEEEEKMVLPGGVEPPTF